MSVLTVICGEKLTPSRCNVDTSNHAMKHSFLLAATLAVSLALPGAAQTQIPAPSGWTTQVKANGATTFTPRNLRAGEIYSVTVYDSAPLGGKSPEAYLRAFAGPVGKTVGELGTPLHIKTREGFAVGGGAYVGPNGTALVVVFTGISVDGGAHIHTTRTLTSQVGLLERYKSQNTAITNQLSERAQAEAEAGNASQVPGVASQQLKTIGGPLVPGVYTGDQWNEGKFSCRVRVYLYGNGEYRFTREDDGDVTASYSTVMGVGRFGYNARNGQLDLDSTFDLSNRTSVFGNELCVFGRDAAGKPAIYGETDGPHIVTRLTYLGPPTKRPSPSAVAAREREKARYKFVTAPGKGIQNAQIAAVLHHKSYSADQMSSSSEAYLLLRDGTIRVGLPVPIDQMDLAHSHLKEPEKWGKWRQSAGKYQVSWHGGPYQALVADKAVMGATGARLNAYYGTASSSSMGAMGGSFAYWGVTFKGNGRFEKHSRGGSSFSGGENGVSVMSGYDNTGSGAIGGGVSVVTTKNPNGDHEGTYSLNGYTLTLRYDNGQVARMPFFFSDAAHKQAWFEGDLLWLDFDK